MNYKEMAIYAIIAIIVVAIVLFVVSRSLVPASYNVRVSLAQVGQSAIYPYQSSNYQINITNTGHSPITGLLVGFYMNGQSQSTNSVSIPAGQTITLTRNFTYPTPGFYSFQAVADPGHLLNIANRTLAQSTIVANITPATAPNVYLSVPNTNINNTESFELDTLGMLSTSAVGARYDIATVDRFFGPSGSLIESTFQNVYPYTANVFGADVQYKDNTTAYAAWLQGTVNPQLINVVIHSFGVNTLKVQNTSLYYAQINKTTSICTFYSGGWTKIITYYNDSTAGTCVNVASVTYTPTVSNTIIKLIESNASLTHYQSGLFYTNSSILGSAVDYSNNSITAINVFNNSYGLFIGGLQRLASPRSANALLANSTCYGLIYNNGNTHVCTYVIPTRTGNFSLPYGLTNSTYLTTNYTINLYSLVNNTQLVAAHNNAANLLNALAVNESSVPWASEFKNTCQFNNQSIGCTFRGFATTNSTASFNITNNFNSTIRINRLNCELLPGFANVTVNTTIAPGASKEFTQMCSTVAVPEAGGATSYILLLNYTYQNKVHLINGTFNLSSQGSV